MRPPRTCLAALLATSASLLLLVAPAFAAGPPFPDPVPGRVVYDEAGIFGAATETEATRVIESIETRTGAEVVVYTQLKPGVSDEEAAADAQALGNQWGIGRAGFDDGLVILFDMEDDRLHGAVQLQAGPGYKAAYLSDAERQAIYDERMLPLLRDGRIEVALLAGLRAVDANATPAHGQALDTARTLNALVGLVVAPALLVLLLGIFGWRWYRVGRDPVYLDDPSIHMPAPPPGLSPAVAALLIDDRSTTHTFTTALVDLASRGEIAFDPQPGLIATKASIVLVDRAGYSDPEELKTLRLSLGAAEGGLLRSLMREFVDGRIEPDDLYVLKQPVEVFDRALEKEATTAGWLREPPKKAITRWSIAGGVEAVGGIVAVVWAYAWVASGLMVLGGALIVAGIATMILSRFMSARTQEGARLFAWLSAYRRTLQKTMAAAGSMTEVATSGALPWVKTPDEATVWGVALGLHREVEAILQRSADPSTTASGSLWYPAWYGVGTSARLAGGRAPSLFSASAVLDFGGMFAALGSIRGAALAPRSGGGGLGGFGGLGRFGGGGGFGGGSVGGRF